MSKSWKKANIYTLEIFTGLNVADFATVLTYSTTFTFINADKRFHIIYPRYSLKEDCKLFLQSIFMILTCLAKFSSTERTIHPDRVCESFCLFFIWVTKPGIAFLSKSSVFISVKPGLSKPDIN